MEVRWLNSGGKKDEDITIPEFMDEQPIEKPKSVFEYFSKYKDDGDQPVTMPEPKKNSRKSSRDSSNQNIPIVQDMPLPEPEKPKSIKKTSRGSNGSKKSSGRKTSDVREIIKPPSNKKTSSRKSSPKPPSQPKRRLVSRLRSKVKKITNNSKLKRTENAIKEGIDKGIDAGLEVGVTAGVKIVNKGKKTITKSNARKAGKAVAKGIARGVKAVPKAMQQVDETLTGVGATHDVTDLVRLKYEHDKITRYRAEYKASHASDTGYLKFENWMTRHYPDFIEAHPDAVASYDKHRTFPAGLPKYDSGDPYKRYYTGGKKGRGGYTPYPDYHGGPTTIKDLIAGTAAHAAKVNKDGYHDMQKRFEKNAENMHHGRERGKADIPGVIGNKNRGLPAANRQKGLPPAGKTTPQLTGHRGGLRKAGETAVNVKIGLRSKVDIGVRKPNVELGRIPNAGPKANRTNVELGRIPNVGPGVNRPEVELGRIPNADLGGHKRGPNLGTKPITGGNVLKGNKPNTNTLGDKRRPSYNIVKGRAKVPTKPSNPLGLMPKKSGMFTKGKKHKFEAANEPTNEYVDNPTLEEFIDGTRPSALNGNKGFIQ